MGVDPGADIAFEQAWPDPGFGDVVAEAADRIIASNTELDVRRASYRVAEESLRLEVREQYPDIALGGGYGNEGDDRLLLGVSIPVPILNANRGGIAEARARRALVRAEAEGLFESLLHRHAVLRARLASLVERREAFSGTALLIDEQRDELARLAELGEVDVLLLADTLSRWAQTRLRLIDLETDDLRTRVALHELMGPAPATEGDDR
ncbi:MAG: hypothetical protein Tsb0013_06310 [Phycisphaerales bacterium]